MERNWLRFGSKEGKENWCDRSTSVGIGKRKRRETKKQTLTSLALEPFSSVVPAWRMPAEPLPIA